MEIEVTVPGLLSDCTGDRTQFVLQAETLAGALSGLISEHPLLRVHLYDESASLRKHIVIFYNGENIKRLQSLELPLGAGDRLDVLQNVSGG
jgi:molybdopterin converting factor small subunit